MEKIIRPGQFRINEIVYILYYPNKPLGIIIDIYNYSDESILYIKNTTNNQIETFCYISSIQKLNSEELSIAKLELL